MIPRPSITFYPLGNADSYLLELINSKLLLFDYADTRCADDPNDKRIDLGKVLRERLDSLGRDAMDVVAFTHLDDDHVCGAPEFFWLEHAKKYQGEGRIKINTLWVPAAAITEERADLGAAGKIIQAEARYRLRQGTGIRVFSRPAALKQWLEGEGLTLAGRAALLTDAGQLVPGFTTAVDGVEFFVHSPFAARHDGKLIDRNSCSLVFQATFTVDGVATRFILSADSPHDVLTDMVRVTRTHHNEHRLAWDIFKLPHHCSYLSLSPDKGVHKTEPVPDVRWLFEQGAEGGIVVSTSDPIPVIDTVQPPHRQAAAYYRERCGAIRGEFKVTMEHPTVARPEPLVITISRSGATIQKQISGAAAAATRRSAPRAG